jgi:DNA-binding CsgD family transcriptional regulator
MDSQDERQLQRTVTILLVVIGLAGGIDLALDRPTQWLSFHVLYELGLVLGSLGTAIWLARGWRGAAAANRELQASLTERKAERDAWRASAEQALAGLGSAIDTQFAAWGLTPAEREVALLVLKGHGHKEIAARTDRSERTVRQHAAAAYEKAGLGGRAELAAFFLEGVALPAPRPAVNGQP